jgi:hypothetical protein
MRALALAALVSLAPGVLFAEGVTSGLYRLQVDGGEGSLKISDGAASIDITSSGRCSGSAEGLLSKVGDRLFALTDSRHGDVCRIEIEVDGGGLPISTADAGGCFAYRGASCGFHGSVLGRDVDVSISAIDAGFNALPREGRLEIQRALSEAGHYAGAIDGVTGRGTRGAIIAAARAVIATSLDVDLSTRPGVDAFLTELTGTSAVKAYIGDQDIYVGPNDFHGLWECDSDMFEEKVEFIFAKRSVTLRNPGVTMAHDDPIAIGDSNSSFLLEMDDGERLGLFEITPMTMVIMSNDYVFNCRRAAE